MKISVARLVCCSSVVCLRWRAAWGWEYLSVMRGKNFFSAECRFSLIVESVDKKKTRVDELIRTISDGSTHSKSALFEAFPSTWHWSSSATIAWFSFVWPKERREQSESVKRHSRRDARLLSIVLCQSREQLTTISSLSHTKIFWWRVPVNKLRELFCKAERYQSVKMTDKRWRSVCFFHRLSNWIYFSDGKFYWINICRCSLIKSSFYLAKTKTNFTTLFKYSMTIDNCLCVALFPFWLSVCFNGKVQFGDKLHSTHIKVHRLKRPAFNYSFGSGRNLSLATLKRVKNAVFQWERNARCDLSVSSIVGDAFFSFKWVSDRCHSRSDEKTSYVLHKSKEQQTMEIVWVW